MQATHHWQALASDRADLWNESLEDRKEILLRIFGWIKDKAVAPLAVTDPVLFAELYADQSLREFRESRHDRGKLRDLVIEDLEHVKDAAEELAKLKPSENVVETFLSRIGANFGESLAIQTSFGALSTCLRSRVLMRGDGCSTSVNRS